MNESKSDYRFSVDANVLFLAVIAILITIGLFAMFAFGRLSTLQARITILESKDFSEKIGVLQEKVGWLEDRELAQEKLRTEEYHKLLKGEGK